LKAFRISPPITITPNNLLERETYQGVPNRKPIH